MSAERLVNPGSGEEDQQVEKSLRPRRLAEFIGQEKVVEQLKIAIAAAQGRSEPLDHTLLYGPPGLGKTSLAGVLANEMGVNIKLTSGPAIERAGDLAAVLTNLQKDDILFIDEIHRLNRAIEEVLYPAMEDFALDIMVGKGPSARSLRLKLPRFTAIGATTRLALLTSPLRDRFGSVMRLEFYSDDALFDIVLWVGEHFPLNLPAIHGHALKLMNLASTKTIAACYEPLSNSSMAGRSGSRHSPQHWPKRAMRLRMSTSRFCYSSAFCSAPHVAGSQPGAPTNILGCHIPSVSTPTAASRHACGDCCGIPALCAEPLSMPARPPQERISSPWPTTYLDIV